MRRAWALKAVARTYFSSANAQQECGHEAKFDEVKALVAGRSRKGLWQLVRAVCAVVKPVIVKLRRADKTRESEYPNLFTMCVDLKAQLLEKMVEHKEVLFNAMGPSEPACQEVWSASISLIGTTTRRIFTRLMGKWALASHLLDPTHVSKWREERMQHGPLHLEADFDPGKRKAFPHSLEDCRKLNILNGNSKLDFKI